MAVAAMAFVIPSIASAQWTDGTNAIPGSINVVFHGPASFTSTIGGVSCTESTSEGSAEPGTTGTILAFAAAGCTTSGGLAGCTVTTVKADTLPWTVHIKETKDVEITGVNITNTFHGAFCPYHEITLFGNVTATPHNSHAIDTITLGNGAGGLEAFNSTTGATIAPITAAGTQTVTPANTYGIT